MRNTGVWSGGMINSEATKPRLLIGVYALVSKASKLRLDDPFQGLQLLLGHVMWYLDCDSDIWSAAPAMRYDEIDNSFRKLHDQPHAGCGVPSPWAGVIGVAVVPERIQGHFDRSDQLQFSFKGPNLVLFCKTTDMPGGQRRRHGRHG